MRLFLTFVFFLFVCSCCSVAYADTLYPSCGGDEKEGRANAGQEATIYTIPETSQNLTLTCLAYEVKSLTGGMSSGEDPCSVMHQTEYRYHLVMRASYISGESGKRVTTDYDVKDAMGGSLSSIAIRLPEKARFSLVFINSGFNKKCSLSARAIMDYTLSAKDTNNAELPVVVGIVPRTVYTNRTAVTRFVLRYPPKTPMEDKKKDTLLLTPLNVECLSDTGFHMRLPSHLPSLDSYENRETLAVRDYFFDKPEAYRLCYKAPGDSVSSELAIIGVFDGNPSYYQVISGQDEKGHVSVGVPTVIKFYGYDLDTRPGGDSAKFVEEHESCAAGRPSGGVPEATDLGPSDYYGPQTTFTTWQWTLLEGGAFKVCYRRRFGGWTEVPSIGEAESTPWTQRQPDAKVPRPTDPLSKQECPMAPESTPEKPWATYKTIKMTMSDRTLRDDFLNALSKSFCIPRAALTVAHKSHNLQGELVVFLAIYCEDLGNPLPCDTVERQNYITYIGATNPNLLRGVGIASVDGSKLMFARGDDVVVVKGGGRVLSVFIACTTVLIVVSLTVYGVLKYREKREYFIQFGADEGDVEDMYVGGGPGDDFGGGGHRTVKNAVIEVEE